MLKKQKITYDAKKQFRLGLNGKLLVGIVLPLVVILFTLAIIITTQVLSVVSIVKSNNISNQITAAVTQVQEYFEKFFISEEFIKDRHSIVSILEEAENSSEDFRFEDSELFDAVLRDLQHAYSVQQADAIQSVWIAGVKNSQLMQSNGYLSDENYDVPSRPWFKSLLEKPNQSVLSPAYSDIATGKMVITVCSPIYDSSNKIIGAIGIDVFVDELSEYLNNITIGKSGYLTIYDSKQNIIHHPDQSTLMKNLSEIDYSDNMMSMLKDHKSTDVTKYVRNGVEYYGSVKYLDKLGWSVLGCMPKDEYLQEAKFIFITITVGFLICIIILVLICISHSKKIVKPLKALNSVAKEIAKGNLDVVIERSSNDELGDLTDVFINTQASLREIISDIGYVIKELSLKNLTVYPTANYQGSFVQIEVALKEIADRMNIVLQIINDTADQVDSGAEHVANGSQSLAQGSTEQASSVEELAATINDISQQMQQMSSHAQEASDKATNVGRDVEQSSNKMHLMVEAMERIDQSSNEIQKIIKAIEDIAFQTNILALNAAVEAARAGTAGKGFAVVADEVRNLASKSADASKTTATLISNSLSAIKDGMLLAKEANDSLVSAVDDVQGVAENIHYVSDDLKNYSSTMQQLTIGVDQISDVVQTNSATAEESAAASEQLSAQASALKDIMNEFKLRS